MKKFQMTERYLDNSQVIKFTLNFIYIHMMHSLISRDNGVR